MSRVRIPLVVLLLILVLMLPALAGQQPRLIVDNRLDSRATIQVWRYNGERWDWTTVATVEPHHWVPVYKVNANDRFRALPPQRGETLSHTVSLYADKGYGGLQDIWLLK